MPSITPIKPTPIKPTTIQPIAPAGYSGNAVPVMQPFPGDASKNWYEMARQEMANPGASPADKPKWVKPNPPITPLMSRADLKALAKKHNWEAVAFNRPGPPAELTVIQFQANGEPLISRDGKAFTELDEVHHLPSIWQHHVEVYCRRIAPDNAWSEEARRRDVGMHIEALEYQIAILDKDLEEYAKACGAAPDSISLKAAADTCTVLRRTLEEKLAALRREQAEDSMELRVLPGPAGAGEPAVPPAPSQVEGDRFNDPADNWVAEPGPDAVELQNLGGSLGPDGRPRPGR
jgi:hypothetical protein